MGQATVNAKLRADSTEFIAGVRNAGRALQGLKAEAARSRQATERLSQTAGLLKSGLSSLLGGIVAVQGGMQAFEKTINSTQTTGDAWAVQVAGLKGAVDSFFTTIATGDWSNLLDGMGEALSRSRELAAELDKLANTRMAKDYATLKSQELIAKARELSTDPNASISDKKKALRDAQEYNENRIRVNEVHIQTARSAAVKTFEAGASNMSYTNAVTGLPVSRETKMRLAGRKMGRSISQEEIDWLITTGATGMDTQLEEYKAKVAELRMLASAREYSTSHSQYGSVTTSAYTQEARRAAEELARLVEKNTDLERKRQLVDLTSDENEQKALELLGEAMRTNIELHTDRARLNKTGRKLEIEIEDSEKNILPQGSIAAAEKQIKDLQEKLGKATSDSSRALLSKSIEDLKAKLGKLKISAGEWQPIDQEAIEKILVGNIDEHIADAMTNGGASGAKKIVRELDVAIRNKRFELQLELSRERRARLQGELSELEDQRIRVSRMGEPDKILGTPTALIGGMPRGAMIDIPNKSEVLDEWSRSVQDAITRNKEMLDTLNNIGGTFEGLGDIIGGSGGEMLKWAGNVGQAVAQALPKIIALTGAQKAQAVSGAAAHGSFLGPIGAIASIAAVLSAFAAMPKFAQGGVVGGSSYYGDKILARVNSGEMIATIQQQERIYKAMEAGRGQVLAQHISLGGEFVIRGGDLVLALDRAKRYNGR